MRHLRTLRESRLTNFKWGKEMPCSTEFQLHSNGSYSLSKGPVMVSSDRQTIKRAHPLQSTGLLPFPLGRVSQGETRVAVMEIQCSLILNGVSDNTTKCAFMSETPPLCRRIKAWSGMWRHMGSLLSPGKGGEGSVAMNTLNASSQSSLFFTCCLLTVKLWQ